MSSYEPFRIHSHRGRDIDEDAEKLIASDPQSRSASTNIPRRRNAASGKATRGNYARVGLRVIALIFAITILAVQIHSVYVWLTTRNSLYENPSTGLETRSWAIINAWPNWVMIGAAALAAVIQLSALTSHLCVCLVDRHGSKQHAVSVYLTSAILIGCWIAAMVHFKLADYLDKNKSIWDIWTWSCHNQHKKGEIPWKSLCVEQKSTFYSSIIVVVIEILVLALFVYNRTGMKSAQSQGKFSMVPS